MKKIKCILFDLDGTLVNTGPDLLECLNYILKIQNLRCMKINEIGNLIGGGAAEMIRKAYSINNKSLKSDELADMVEQFLEFYRKNTTSKSKLYSNILEILIRLKKKNFVLGVCTNKKQYLAEKVLSELKISKYFSLILGSSTKLKLKPNTDMLEYCVKMLGFNFEETIMIGDSNNDIEPAFKLNMQSIFVKYGFGKIEKYQPSYVVDNAIKILDCLK